MKGQQEQPKASKRGRYQNEKHQRVAWRGGGRENSKLQSSDLSSQLLRDKVHVSWFPKAAAEGGRKSKTWLLTHWSVAAPWSHLNRTPEGDLSAPPAPHTRSCSPPGKIQSHCKAKHQTYELHPTDKKNEFRAVLKFCLKGEHIDPHTHSCDPFFSIASRDAPRET